MNTFYYCILKNYKGTLIKKHTGNTHIFGVPLENSFYYMSFIGRVTNYENTFIGILISELELSIYERFIEEQQKYFGERYVIVDAIPSVISTNKNHVIRIKPSFFTENILSNIKIRFLPEHSADFRYYVIEGKFNFELDNISPDSVLNIR